jgi:membrane-associated phospholipid phosphatase
VLRTLAVAMTLAMDAAVVVTANHYLLDVVAGAALAAVAWRVACRGSRPARARVRPLPITDLTVPLPP